MSTYEVGQSWLADVTGRVPWARAHERVFSPSRIVWVSTDASVVDVLAFPPGRKQCPQQTSLSVTRLIRKLEDEREFRQLRKAVRRGQRKRDGDAGRLFGAAEGDGT